jgi:phenylacetyl-CoA:acceptor oxidoreductase subunit 2
MSHYGPRPWVQRHWDVRAAANFMLGGTGAGLLIASAIAAPVPSFPILAGLALIAIGLGAVWLEIGRKLRALHVFFNPGTSWMTRESFAAIVVFALGGSTLMHPQPWLLSALALAAAWFVYCQARILRASKGIPAWRAPQVVPLIVASALAEGAGAALLFETVPLALPLVGLAALARAIAWWRFRGALKHERCAAALERPGKMLVLLGTVVPLGLLAATLAEPRAALLAAIAIVATGWWFKLALVTRAAFNQGFALPHVPVRGARQEDPT